MAGKIFISYRRDDNPDAAARLRDALVRPFGRDNVILDVDHLIAGQRFEAQLDKALSQCDVLIAVIGPRWMETLLARQESGERDYVVEEISAALKRKITVIPVRVGRESGLLNLPRPAELPDEIRDLVDHQKHDVTYERFPRDVEGLANAIKAVRRGQRTRLTFGGAVERLSLTGAVLASLALSACATYTTYEGVQYLLPPVVAGFFSFGLQFLVFMLAWLVAAAVHQWRIKGAVSYIVAYSAAALVSILFSYVSIYEVIVSEPQRREENARYARHLVNPGLFEIERRLQAYRDDPQIRVSANAVAEMSQRLANFDKQCSAHSLTAPAKLGTFSDIADAARYCVLIAGLPSGERLGSSFGSIEGFLQRLSYEEAWRRAPTEAEKRDDPSSEYRVRLAIYSRALVDGSPQAYAAAGLAAGIDLLLLLIAIAGRSMQAQLLENDRARRQSQ